MIETARKKEGKVIDTFQLGVIDPREDEILAHGILVLCEENETLTKSDGTVQECGAYYEVMSREAELGGTGEGEKAAPGWWVVIDVNGQPYFHDDVYHDKNVVLQENGEYMQMPATLAIYEKGGEMPEEVAWLIENGKLEIDPSDPDKYYNAELWGTLEAAKDDAVVVIYGAARDEQGEITNVDFNFVSRDVFDKTYDYVDRDPELEKKEEGKTKVLWFSRHDMTKEQLAALGPNVKVEQVNKTINSAYELQDEIARNDVIAIVAPINLQQQFLKLANGKPVIMAVNDRVLVPQQDGEDKAEFRFVKWEQLDAITIEKHDYVPKTLKKENLYEKYAKGLNRSESEVIRKGVEAGLSEEQLMELHDSAGEVPLETLARMCDIDIATNGMAQGTPNVAQSPETEKTNDDPDVGDGHNDV